jgi:hypothetical protein
VPPSQTSPGYSLNANLDHKWIRLPTQKTTAIQPAFIPLPSQMLGVGSHTQARCCDLSLIQSARNNGQSSLSQVKWFTEFGHLNRGDMLTSEHYRCLNEKEISAQSLNANPLNWSLTRTTPLQLRPVLWMSAFPP